MAKPTKKPGTTVVGYKNPPRHTQFQKGKSGNPTGKSKKPESIEAKLKKLAAKEILVTENGVPVAMTQDEAMLVTVFMKAMKGDLAAVKFVTERIGNDDEPVVQKPELKLTPDDLNVLKRRADWIHLYEQARAEVDAEYTPPTSTEEVQNDDPDETF